ncbi:retroviral-like aspartic protease family protein [Aestuariibacter halophilus]|uniref:Retroviral-like aspartic protease family protein n=1 Tax=Fluctibacter halophilus TaxID=226011 RepID=A0ABS8GAK8_9ALTE|nr:retropepsin-like aspartic protease [Aestuariibacter halophilus]MCC2616749.1 retroviral-like aspartic protease family protein [Aestuariibacter halophilus]
MNRIAIWLALLLLFSVAMNLWLYQQWQQDRHIESQTATNDNAPTPQVAVPASQPASPATVVASDPLQRITDLLTARRYAEARDALQLHLQRFPDDIEGLLLEGRLTEQTQPVIDAIAFYYQLLERSLSTQHQAEIHRRIAALTEPSIGNLKSIKAWAILADFVEPLWQFAPDNRDYMLALGEAYARQAMPTLVDFVLASLPPDDPDSLRIRHILAASSTPAPTATASTAIPLRRQGDHYLVNAMLNQSQVTLMLDTGASTTAISRETFARWQDDADVRYVGEYRLNTAGGQITAPVYRFLALSLGDETLSDLAVVVLPVERIGNSDGLLGMDVLREFVFSIDQSSATLSLSRRASFTN